MEKIKDNVIKLNANLDIIDALYVDGEEERVKNTERIIGFEDGLEVGEKEGFNKRNLEIAKNMLFKGMNIQDISDITGLSKEEIEKLK